MKDKETKYSGIKEEPEKKKVPKEEKVKIMFRERRKFDLHVGREMITFRDRELKEIPKSWLKHPDFIQVKNKFVVKGV